MGPAVGLLVPAAEAHETAPLGTPVSAELYSMPGTHLAELDGVVDTSPPTDPTPADRTPPGPAEPTP